MIFTCILNKKTVTLPISFDSQQRCKYDMRKIVNQPNPAQLSKMDRSKEFSNIHGDKMLANISEKIKKDCCAENPNSFWKQENYFVSLPFDPQQKIKPMKASARLMSPTEREFCENEIK